MKSPSPDLRRWWQIVVLCLLVWGGSSAVLRPLYPLDETRYASIAWAMRRLGSWWPVLGEQLYSHKPPLLFWLMRLAWWVGGYSTLSLRLLMLALTMACLWRSVVLSSMLWGRRPEVVLAAALLAGNWYVAAMGTAVYFDMALTLWTVLTIEGLWRAAGGQRWGFVLAGCALGLGALTKGPLIGPFVIGPMLAMPWIVGHSIKGWWRGVLMTGLLASLALLGWFVALGLVHGVDIVRAIVWNQGAGRVVAAFDHARPWWWYAPWLLVLWLPWVSWPVLWRLRWAIWRDVGGRLCLAWMVPPVVLLSIASGKQPHYLLPLFPAIALVLGRALERMTDTSRRALLGPGLLFVIGGLALLGGWHLVPALRFWLSWNQVLLWTVGGIVLGAMVVLVGRGLTVQRQVMWLAVCALLGLCLGQVVLVKALASRYDLRAFAGTIAHLQARGLIVAKAGVYHGQFDFLGRLEQPIVAVPRAQICDWGERHPRAVVIVELPGHWRSASAADLILVQPYRGHQLALMPPPAACRVLQQLS